MKRCINEIVGASLDEFSGPEAHPELSPHEVRLVLGPVRDQGENRAQPQERPGHSLKTPFASSSFLFRQEKLECFVPVSHFLPV